MEELENSSQADPDAPEMLLPPRVEEAVENAQYLVAYAAEAGKGIDENTVKVLVEARNAVSAKEWSPEIEIAFWGAYNQITNKVKPVTVDSVKALYPSYSGISSLFGKSKARRSVNIYTVLAVVTLTVLLMIQSYLVIGNSLTTDLEDLAQQETDLRAAIKEESKRYAEIELLYKTVEAEQEGFEEQDPYSFYSYPGWYQNTSDITTKLESLKEELDDLQPTLERSAAILMTMTYLYSQNIYIEEDDGDPFGDEITAVKDQIRLAEKEMNADPMAQLEELLMQLEDLDEVLLIGVEAKNESSEQTVAIIDKREELLEQIDSLKIWLNEPGRADQILEQRQQNLNDLNKRLADLERQSSTQRIRVLVQRAKKTAELMLDVLQFMQSYFLPLLYGLLGATVYILRSLSRDIKTVTYSKHSDIGYILRLALGTLSGLVVGWFIFALPGTTILSSISPLAIAFLVGYNIEILFSLMDKLRDSLSKSETAEEPETSK